MLGVKLGIVLIRMANRCKTCEGLCSSEYHIAVPILHSELDCQQPYLTKDWRDLVPTQDSWTPLRRIRWNGGTLSEQFVQRADRVLLIRSYFEAKRLGNILNWLVGSLNILKGESLPILDCRQRFCTAKISNEICSGIPESNHRNICRFETAESQRCIGPSGKQFTR